MKVHSAASVSAAFAARNPGSAGELPSIEAQAMKGLSSLTSTKWVKATENFYVSGEPVLVGDLVEVQEADANRLIRGNQAVANLR